VLSFIGLLTLWLLFGSAELSGSDQELTVANPLYVSSLGDGFALDPLLAVLYPLLFTLAVLSLVLRFRRADGEQRQQVKWVVFGVVAALIGTIASTALQRAAVISALIGGLSLLAVPVTIGVSVLRYRLYDLDVIVKKALVAATIVLVVVAGYVGLVSLAGVLTTEVGSGVVFVIALGFGIAFRPVTRLARRVADRLVYGRRATPYEVLSEFSGRVGEAYATDDVLGRMAATLGKGVGAERARVWLRVGDELRVASAWPDDGLAVAPLPVLGEALLETGGEDVVEVRDRGELIGALSVVVPANDPMNPGRVKLVRDLAAQAGLALRNVRLVEELRASRRRLVTAQDEERRRLERNIHDGAQQQLVALNVQLGLLAKLTEREPAKASQMAAQLQVRATEALEELRGLARGIYPPLLADRGLGAALEAQARRATVPVKVDVAFDRRYPSEIEAAVYFSCLEGLQNVAKYAEATSVELRAGAEDGWLVFEVVDDGRGFDPSANGFGTGLQGIADRLGAIGGGIEVVSAPGRGTTIRGRVPTSASLRDQVPIGEG
jgi:signal transduction histidine kinase